MKQDIQRLFDDSIEALRQTAGRLAGPLEQAAAMIVEAYRNGGGVLVFGNGGSASDAQHIAGELVGRFLVNRPALKAEALSSNTSVLTCIANDFGYDAVFSRQIEANATARDVVIALSTSGNSANIVTALAKARQIGAGTILLSGEGGGQAAQHADILLDVPSRHTPRIQESHVVLYHILCELVEQAMVRS